MCPAYRGYGVSRHLDGAYTVEEIAADCLELAGAMGADRFDLVGHSMGGKVIQRMLALGGRGLPWADRGQRGAGEADPRRPRPGDERRPDAKDVVRLVPNCLIETIPGGGHYLPDETPIALATSIQAFLE